MGSEKIIVVLYVDDVLIVGSSKAVQMIKNLLAREFDMTDIGEIRNFLGISVDYRINEGILRLSQKQYLLDVLKRFQMIDCKPISTPLENRLKLPSGTEKDQIAKPYREIGCLTYATMTTRPDLAAAVNFLSQFQSCPNEIHWVHLRRILRYIKGSIDFGLTYRRNKTSPMIEVFSDADWANNLSNRRSVNGCLFKVFGSTVCWITRKQQTVALSSTEAELAALCVAACHVMWLTRLLQDLWCESNEPVIMYEDNQSAMKVSEESKDYGRLKHVDVKLHFLRDLIKRNQVRLQFIPSSDQPADMMTKGLPTSTFQRHRASIGLSSCSD